MSKINLFFLLLVTTIVNAQFTNYFSSGVRFKADIPIWNANIFALKSFSFEAKNQEKPFSIYNPIPGFNPTGITPNRYYSFENSTRLLNFEMKNKKKEPIFPDTKKESIGESLFFGVLGAILDK